MVRESRIELYSQILDELAVSKKGSNVKFLPARSNPELAIEPFNGMAVQMGDDDATIATSDEEALAKRKLIQPIRYDPNRTFRFNSPKDR